MADGQPPYSADIHRQLVELAIQRSDTYFGGFNKYSSTRVRQNWERASDQQLMRALNASQAEWQAAATEPGDFNPFRYH